MKDAREKGRVSKVELAKATGISRQTIDRIERGGTWGVDVEILYLHALGMAHFQAIYGEENGQRVVTKMVLVPVQK
jgi:DNA-binding XRE family transcriptional regulator